MNQQGHAWKRAAAITGLMLMTAFAFANCRGLNKTDASWQIDRLVGCKSAWVPGSGDAGAPAVTPRRSALHDAASKIASPR